MAVDTSYSVLDGSLAAPAFAFLNAPTTGFFRDPLTGAIFATIAGVKGAQLGGAAAAGGAPAVQVGSAAPITGAQAVQLYAKYTGTPFLLVSATATKQVMDQFTLPANALLPGHRLRFTVWGIHAADTNIGNVEVTFGSAAGAYQTTVSGGTTIAVMNAAVSSGIWFAEYDLFQSAASVQRSQARIYSGATVVNPTDLALTQDMTTAKLVTLALTTATSAASCTIYGWEAVLV